MRAIRLHEFNGPLSVEEVADPVAVDGEMLIELTHAAINPLDVWACQGNFAAITKLPHTPGAEGLGRDSSGHLGLVNGGGIGIARPGTYAEKIAIAPVSWSPIADESIDPGIAVSMCVAGVTAHRAVHHLAKTTAADTVLVLGASGGVGSVAAQLARTTGATVLGQTSSEAKRRAVEAAGCNEVVIAADGDALVRALGDRKVGVVIDGLGGTFTAAAITCMSPFARLVNYGTSAGVDVMLNMRNLYRNGVSVFGYTGLLLTPDERAATLDLLFAEVKAGRLTIAIDEILPLSKAGEAHQRILNKGVEGKLVLDVRA
jgi:NADPH:quinone reductase